MKTRALLLALPLVVGLAACTKGNSASVVPAGLCAPPITATPCTSFGKCSAYLGGAPFFYLWVPGGLPTCGGAGPCPNPEMGYFMEFDNQLPDNTDTSSGQVNTNGAWIDAVALSYTVHANAAVPAFAIPDQTAHTSPTFIPASSQGTPLVDLVPPAAWSTLDANIPAATVVNIDVELRGVGHYADGSSFQTGPLTIPIWVYNDVFDAAAYYPCTGGAPVAATCPYPGEGGAGFTCGIAGGGGSTTYTIGGNISGLTASGLVLDSGVAGISTLSVAAGSTTFTFSGTVATGTVYNVTVATQPTGQTCTVTAGTGSGTVGSANVVSVAITCL